MSVVQRLARIPARVITANGAIVTTSRCRWSSNDNTLFCHHGDSSSAQVFPSTIRRFAANEAQCIVETADAGANTFTIWNSDAVPISTGVRFWLLPPERLVYQVGDDIIVRTLQGAAHVAGHGTLISASNTRFIYEDAEGRKWDNGEPAAGVKYLSATDEVVLAKRVDF